MLTDDSMSPRLQSRLTARRGRAGKKGQKNTNEDLFCASFPGWVAGRETMEWHKLVHSNSGPRYDMFKHGLCVGVFQQLKGGTHFFIWRNQAAKRLDRGRAGSGRQPLQNSLSPRPMPCSRERRDCSPNDKVLIVSV